MVFSAPAMLTVRISRLLRTVKLVDQPDPALFLKSDRVRDQPVTRSPRRRARRTPSPLQDARARGSVRQATSAHPPFVCMWKDKSGNHVTPTLLPAGAIEALALCDAPLPARLSLPPCSSHARGEPVATVRALPACAARCFCRHAADSAHSPWPEPCTFLRLCVALLRSEGMHRRLQDPVSMREEGVHRTF